MQAIRNNMGLFADRKGDQNVFIQSAESVTLTPRDHVVRVAAQTAGVTVTLPPVADCAGCTFGITAASGVTHNVTVADQDDSLGWTDQVINTAEGGVLIWCDGQKFWVIGN